MIALLGGLGLMVVAGLFAWTLGNRVAVACRVGGWGCAAGCVAAAAAVVAGLFGGNAAAAECGWRLPLGAVRVGMDALSAFFLLPTLGLSALAAVYGSEYLREDGGRRAVGRSWFCYNLLVASMVLVLIARDAVLFMLAWEGMALASFFLVMYDAGRDGVRRAGYIYLVATHLGGGCLIALFVLLGRAAGGMGFDAFAGLGPLSAGAAASFFILALAGFGSKAGFMPVHVWLPEAHPVAPSHVSAVMSGVMIKTGIYGLVRVLSFLHPWHEWWGWTLVVIGAVSGILGVLFALAQHDLKRLLAYHSVENIGIITLGLGLGVVGVIEQNAALAVLGFGGGLLHVLNHALFKGLLFLGAGSVLHAAGTADMDEMGGLMKRMRWTGLTFLVGAAAISGLPPLNGFVSEFLIYLGAFGSGVQNGKSAAFPSLVAIGSLALIGGLALACFSKAFGIVFLGEPRGEHAAHAHEAGWAMTGPMAVLAASCALVALAAPAVVRALAPVAAAVTGMPADAVKAQLGAAGGVLWRVLIGTSVLCAAAAALACARRAVLRRREVGETVTWDCGFARPTARMQYTASSFAQPLTAFYGWFLRAHTRLKAPEGLFPREATFHSETPDVFAEGLFAPLFTSVQRGLSVLRAIQHGRIHLYVLCIAVMLLVLLVWKL